MHEMSPSEKQLAEENLRLKAEVDFLRTLVALDDLNSKKNSIPDHRRTILQIYHFITLLYRRNKPEQLLSLEIAC